MKLSFLQKLGFESITITIPKRSSLSDGIIQPATGLEVLEDKILKGTFIHKRNPKLLVAFQKEEFTITFGLFNNWKKYFESPRNNAIWLLSLSRWKSNEEAIEETFKMIVKKYGK